MKKSLEDLKAIREKTRGEVMVRDESDSFVRIVVGMATCGIAAGARPVLNAFSEEVAKRKLGNVQVAQTGCIGMCQLEPIVEVTEPGKDKVTYGEMTPDKVVRVVAEHIVNGNPVSEYTIANLMK